METTIFSMGENIKKNNNKWKESPTHLTDKALISLIWKTYLEIMQENPSTQWKNW